MKIWMRIGGMKNNYCAYKIIDTMSMNKVMLHTIICLSCNIIFSIDSLYFFRKNIL